MLKRKSKRIVIDACIARSAGGADAIHNISKSCRDFLVAVRDICHKVAFSGDILREWKKHRSNFSKTWYRTMVARKKVEVINIPDNQSFIVDVNSSSLIEERKKAAIKDLILIRAALKADKIIASYDDKARKNFQALSTEIGEVKDICWVNPTIEEENVIQWLRDGARCGKKRKLGYGK